jgi:hypothetical protein
VVFISYTKIFISYTKPDFDDADEVDSELTTCGFETYFAPRDTPHGNYEATIVDKIRESDGMVLLLSAAALKSPEVQNEVALAIEDAKPIVPFMMKGLTAADVQADDNWRYRFKRIHMYEYLNSRQVRAIVRRNLHTSPSPHPAESHVVPQPATVVSEERRDPGPVASQARDEKDASVPSPPDATLAELSPPDLVFEARPGSCFIHLDQGLTEVFPAESGLQARRVKKDYEWTLLSMGGISSAVIDPPGLTIGCAADGRFAFASIGMRNIAHKGWTFVTLNQEVTAVHAVETRNGGVRAVVTILGEPHHIRADRGGVGEIIAARSGGPLTGTPDSDPPSDSWASETDRATISLQPHQNGQQLVIDRNGVVHILLAPDGATSVQWVRRAGTDGEPDFVIRNGSTARLWNVGKLPAVRPHE